MNAHKWRRASVRSTCGFRRSPTAATSSPPSAGPRRQPLLPPGPKVPFTGGLDFNDHRAIWDRLDKVFAKDPDMVLLHGGSPKGAERIAAC